MAHSAVQKRIGGGHRFGPGNDFAKRGNHDRPRLVTQQLISLLNETDKKSGKSNVRRLCEALLDAAVLDKDVVAIREILDRVDGKVTTPIMPVDAEGEPYEFTLRIGHAGPDGSQTAAEVRLSPPVAVPEAAVSDIRSARQKR